MAGLVKPKNYPIRQVGDDKQDNGIIYNPHRFAHHGGLDTGSKYPGRDGSGFRDVDPPTKTNPAAIANRNNDD